MKSCGLSLQFCLVIVFLFASNPSYSTCHEASWQFNTILIQSYIIPPNSLSSYVRKKHSILAQSSWFRGEVWKTIAHLLEFPINLSELYGLGLYSRVHSSKVRSAEQYLIVSTALYVQVPPGCRGSKASAGTYEPPMTSAEKFYNQRDWGQWWMKIGGFKATLHPTTRYPPTPSPTSSIRQPFPTPIRTHPAHPPPHPTPVTVQCILSILYIQHIPYTLYIL